MHLDRGKLSQYVGNVLELRPIELDVLPRREMPVASIVLAADARQCAQLARRQQPVGNRDAQHRRVLLDVQAVLQAERAEIVLGELTGEISLRLVAKLRDALIDEALIEGVIAVHAVTIGDRENNRKESMAIGLFPTAI